MGREAGSVRAVFRLGVITLRGDTLHIDNRTYHSTVRLVSPEQINRWRKYLMAYGNYGGRRGSGSRYNSTRGRGGKSGKQSVRLTGVFPTKREGLYVGSLRNEEMSALIDKIREARAEGVGLTFFVWENDTKGGPAFSINVDLEQPREKGDFSRRTGHGVGRGSRAIEPDDEPTSADLPDEADPFKDE